MGLISVFIKRYFEYCHFLNINMCFFQIITHVDPLTGCVKYYTPRGRFVHVPPTCPRTDWANDFGKPWWKDMRYEVGILTAKARWIRIINTLTAQEQRLEVKSSCTQHHGYEF